MNDDTLKRELRRALAEVRDLRRLWNLPSPGSDQVYDATAVLEDEWRRRLIGLAHHAGQDNLPCVEQTLLALATILEYRRDAQTRYAQMMADFIETVEAIRSDVAARHQPPH